MQKILTTDLWKNVRATASTAKQRQAAIAFVTRDLIGFRSGDLLIVDASEGAIRAGETDAKLLAKLLEKGIELYDCPALHAKILLLDDTAVIGSANMSASSESKLVEAALMTNAPGTISQVSSVIHQLKKQSTRLTADHVRKLANIEVIRRHGPALGVAGIKRPKISPLGARTWLAGISPLEKELSEEEEEKIEESTAQLAEETASDPETISWIRWTGSGNFAKNVKAGDQLIQIWSPSRKSKCPQSVMRPVPILRCERVKGATVAYFRDPHGRRPKMRWQEFKELMTRLGYGRKMGRGSQCILNPELADGISLNWHNRK